MNPLNWHTLDHFITRSYPMLQTSLFRRQSLSTGPISVESDDQLKPKLSILRRDARRLSDYAPLQVEKVNMDRYKEQNSESRNLNLVIVLNFAPSFTQGSAKPPVERIAIIPTDSNDA